MLISSNKYKLSMEVGTLLMPAHAHCNLLHYHSIFGGSKWQTTESIKS